jgi:hypothetical protein
MIRNGPKLWPERIVLLAIVLWFLVEAHRDLPVVDRTPIGASLLLVGLLVMLLRKFLSRLYSGMWSLEEQLVRFLFLEFGVLIAVGGGTLLLRTLAWR